MLFDSGCVICRSSNGPVCARCASALLPATNTGPVEGLDACRVGYTLDERARTMIAALKYRKQRRIATWLGRELQNLVPLAADVITWLPATPERRRTRGFDQAQELARVLAASTGVPLVQLLRRGANDVRQTGQSRHARQLGPALTTTTASPDFVVLVDDVVTTGSSLRVAAGALRSAGASRLVGVVAAATPPPRESCLPSTEIRCSVDKWT